MIKVFNDTENICNGCDNDSSILIDFTDNMKANDIGTKLYLCENCKRDLIDEILPF